MKKFYLFIIAILAVCLFAFIPQNVKADDATVATVDGASIRTVDPMGLRFAGQVTGEFTGTTIKYGFLLSKGSYTKEQMITLYGTSKAIAREAGETLDGEGKFYLSVVNIPSSGYDQNITALAYVDVDGEKTYAASSCTRNITYVANQLADNDDYKDLDFVKKINNSSTFVFNGGEFVANVEGVVGRYNGGSGGSEGITLGDKGKAYSNSYWNRIFIKRTSISSNIYEKVTYLVGDSKTGNASVTADYDYILAGHSNTPGAPAKITALSAYQYLYISDCADGAIIKAGNNIDALLNGKLLLEDGDTLPNVKKDYYTFDGWYGNVGLTGDAITEKDGNDAETFYAKFTPIEYTITYELQSGATSASPITSYNIESGAIALPAAGTMSIANGEFLGWYDNVGAVGEPITSIPAGSHGNITVYACWEMLVALDLNIGAADVTALNAIYTKDGKVADILVNPNVASGKYILCGDELNSNYDTVEYPVGSNIVASLADAISIASNNDIIYVFAGTYSQNINVTKSVKIYGPNNTILGKNARNTPSIISGIMDIKANGCEVNGLEFTRNLLIGADNIIVDHCHINCTPESTLIDCNRKAAIGGSAHISNLVVKNTYINVHCNKVTYLNEYMAFYNITNLDILNNYITNDCATLGTDYTNDGMGIYTMNGTLNILDNEFYYATNNWLTQVGFTSTNANVNIKNNIASGRGGLQTCTFGFKNVQSGKVITVMNNQWYSLEPATVLVYGTSATLNYQYNYTDSAYATKITCSGTCTTNNNCYAGGTITSGSYVKNIKNDTVIYSTLKEVQDAYAAYLESLG